MESRHLSGRHSDLKTHPSTDFTAGDPSNSDKELRSSSSSRSSASDSSSEDSFELDALKIQGSNDEQSINGAPVVPSAVPDAPATQSPSLQVMERPGDFATTPSYRIPSSVFSRTNTTSPVDWSVCSNESLFSIHVGNTSFNKDPLFWTKSGELGKPGDPYCMPSPLIDYSSNQPPVNKSTELGTVDAKPSDHVGEIEASSAQVMDEVIRDNEENQSEGKLLVAEKGHCSSLSRNSDASGASTKSFAFPILAGNSDKNGSGKTDQHKMLQSSLSQPQTPPTPQTPQMPHDTPQVQPQTSKKETPESQPQNQSQTPKGKHEPSPQSNWLSCFSCCPFHSS